MSKRGLLSAVRKQAAENVAFVTASAAASSACPAGVHVARVVATQDCFIDMGKPASATDTTTSVALRKDQVEYFAINTGHNFSVRGDTSAGNLNVMFATL